ncbi:hypothetical protein [Pontibacter cellulosilyticus]|uniref:Uncharacterized protein n=1 Tax=Pontibacter cellulosilyticus TaxID=1720253 RepID=A0A923N4Q1_9BACT|nr:hypothetical protein [Pontibacter cellulosilyticus]MBC5992181.1 hypothetical protein [Pontibacter cellulosilyticus]
MQKNLPPLLKNKRADNDTLVKTLIVGDSNIKYARFYTLAADNTGFYGRRL